jgi:hypothetical protein
MIRARLATRADAVGSNSQRLVEFPRDHSRFVNAPVPMARRLLLWAGMLRKALLVCGILSRVV